MTLLLREVMNILKDSKIEPINWSKELNKMNDAKEDDYFCLWLNTNDYKELDEHKTLEKLDSIVKKIYSDISELIDYINLGNLNISILQDDELYSFLNKSYFDDATLVNMWDTFGEPINEAINIFKLEVFYSNEYTDEFEIREKICWYFIKMRNHLSKLEAYVEIKSSTYCKLFESFGNISAHGWDGGTDKSQKRSDKNFKMLSTIYNNSKIDFSTPLVQMIDGAMYTCYQLIIIKIFMFFKRFEKNLIKALEKCDVKIEFPPYK
jgi:hypothetical protein